MSEIRNHHPVFAWIVILCAVLVTTASYVAACACDAGGTGATSCSISSNTGCSVSCGSGYYACCSYGGFFTVASCKCAPDGEDIPECNES